MVTNSHDQTKSLKGRGNLFRDGWTLVTIIAVTLAIGTFGSARAAEGISVQKPWMRFIIKERPAGGFFTLKNDTGAALKLIGASSPACGMVMLHQTKEIKGVEHMMPVRSVTVPAHGSLSFHPGGYHVMCMKPQSSMAVGHKVPVTLKFANGKSLTAQFPVKGVSSK